MKYLNISLLILNFLAGPASAQDRKQDYKTPQCVSKGNKALRAECLEHLVQDRIFELQATQMDKEAEQLQRRSKARLIGGATVIGTSGLAILATVIAGPKKGKSRDDARYKLRARQTMLAAMGAGLIIGGPILLTGGIQKIRATDKKKQARQLRAGFSATKTGGTLSLSGSF